MDPTLAAFLQSWPLEPRVVGLLVLTAWVYLRGWTAFRRRGSRRFGPGRLVAFLGGLAAILAALASPIDPFATLLLQVHMVQHLLLMMVAPPLILLGAPQLPLLRGLPAAVRRYWVGPVLRHRWVRRCFHRLTWPPVAWLAFVISTWLWHAPGFYQVALRSDRWHYLEHGCFLATALLFWWPVIQPYPSRPHWSRWVMLPYLFLADVQNTALSALLAFSDRVIYPHYAAVPRLWGISALDDQSVAGVIMWIPGSLAFLVPLVWIGSRLLYGHDERWMTGRNPLDQKSPGPVGFPAPPGPSLPVIAHPSPVPRPDRTVPVGGWDLLGVPLVGRFLRWRHARRVLQAPMAVLAAAIIWDGLRGPQIAPMNLAGVLPWIHWRGLVVLGLLVAGNVFCMACPFMLPRTAARRWLPAGRPWPRRLRSKWLAVGLLAIFFWAYEAFHLWASPWWTAWIALAYFLAAFAVDGWFRGAAFCKYVCPIGQFQFVQSLVSPLEVRVRDPGLCRRCPTKDCIRGGDGIPGCELHLFQPRKSSNLDCTFCLDCVHACPHENVGILATGPGVALLHDPHRSGIGRLGRRPDLAALVLVLVFAAFANAAGMVAPVVQGEDRVIAALRLASPLPVVTAGFAVALLLLPLLLVGAAAGLGRWWSGDRGPWREVATRFSYALAPLGCGMWLAHYTFHFLTGAGGIIAVVQRCAADWGLGSLARPAWGRCCCVAAAPWLLRLEILALDAGLLLSLYLGYRMALDRCPRLPRALKAFAPWAVLMLILFAAGLWIVFQPMQMRGTMQMGR